jgi:hypothetical protein
MTGSGVTQRGFGHNPANRFLSSTGGVVAGLLVPVYFLVYCFNFILSK